MTNEEIDTIRIETLKKFTRASDEVAKAWADPNEWERALVRAGVKHGMERAAEIADNTRTYREAHPDVALIIDAIRREIKP